jgi:hypothetical protein
MSGWGDHPPEQGAVPGTRRALLPRLRTTSSVTYVEREDAALAQYAGEPRPQQQLHRMATLAAPCLPHARPGPRFITLPHAAPPPQTRC